MFSVKHAGWGCVAVVVTLLLTATLTTKAQVTNFTGTYDGTTWINSLNWDNGEPNGSTYDAIIDGPAGTPFDVLLTGGRVVNSLTIGDEDILRISNLQYLEPVTLIDNEGTLRILASTSATALRIETEVSLDGGGTVEMSGYNSYIFDATLTADGHLINNDNLIHGTGHIGHNRMQLTNHSTIRADVNGADLVLDPGAAGFSNDGLFEASDGGYLYLVDGDYTNTGGTILAQTDSAVRFYDGPTIIDGTLQTSGTGIIETANAPLTTLTDVTLDGNLRINNGCNIELTGTFTNNPDSVLLVGASTTATDLLIETPVTLTGGGTIQMSGNNARLLDESGLADTGYLTNQDNLIHGQGSIGFNRMQLTNHGTIRADVNGAYLTLDPGTYSYINDGLYEASDGGILRLSNGTYDNLGGTIHAADSSSVHLIDGPVINNGTFQTTGSGVIETGNAVLATLNNITLDGNLRINNSCNLELKGTITNNTGSVLLVNASTTATDLVIETPVTLTGGGAIQMSGNNARLIDESGLADTGHLVNNDNLIHGQGSIGINRMQLTNHGTIRADVTGASLTLAPGAGGFSNDNLFEATDGGILRLGSGAYDNLGGTIHAADASTVQLIDGPLVTDGTFQTTGAGIIETGNAWLAILTDITLDGNMRINNSHNLELKGTLTNNAASVLLVSASTTATDLLIESDVNLVGAGSIQLSGSLARIYDGDGDPFGHLINHTNLIHGQGQIGVGRTQITNHGTIRADVGGTTLAIDPGDNGLANDGLMEADGGGILYLYDGAYNNTAGIIRARDASSVMLGNGPAITDGTLQTLDSGVIETGNAIVATLTDVTLDGLLRINNSHNLELVGTLTNLPDSVLQVSSSSTATSLHIESDVTLEGGGSIEMVNYNARVYDASGDLLGHLINNDNLIHGQGNLGFNRTQITNHGTIRADVINANLTIDPGDAGLTNDGLLEADNEGFLYLHDGLFNNASGIIRAQAGSSVRLSNSPVITDGLLQTVDDGVIETGSSNVATLTDVTLDGLLRINNSHNIELTGTLINLPGSVLLIASSTTATNLRIESEVTLDGGGAIEMVNNNARIYNASGTPDGHLINNGNLIHGQGNIGFNRTQITNRGEIVADVAGQTLYIETDARDLINTGLLSAKNTATLRIIKAFSNDGQINADLNSTVLVDATLTNNAGGYLTGDGLIKAGTTGAADIINDGDIAPGASAGELTLDVGALSFGSTGSFTAELGGLTAGAEYDQLAVLGNVTLDGTLNASLINGYAPAVGDCFDVLITNGTLTGTFSTVNLPAGPGEGFSIYYGSNYVRITVLRLDGDLNGDGYVGLTDLDIVLNNWNQYVTPGDYLAGDPSGDGYVGLDDLDWVLLNWNTGTQFPTPPAVDVSVPEPATVMLLLAGMIGAVRCKRQ